MLLSINRGSLKTRVTSNLAIITSLTNYISNALPHLACINQRFNKPILWRTLLNLLKILLSTFPTTASTRCEAVGDQPGSLRWAIETSNQNPGHYRIEIAAVGQAPYVIKPTRARPEIKGPVSITGLAWARDGQYIAIDGSGYIKDQGVRTCPGAET